MGGWKNPYRFTQEGGAESNRCGSQGRATVLQRHYWGPSKELSSNALNTSFLEHASTSLWKVWQHRRVLVEWLNDSGSELRFTELILAQVGQINNWAACSKPSTCMYSSLLQKYNLILIWLGCLGPEELSRLAAPPVGSCNFQTFWQWARLHWSSFDWWYQVLEIIEERYLDEWFHCPPIPETTLRGTNVFLSTREQGAGSRRWLKRRCLLYSRCYEVYDGNGKFLGEIFFGENSAGQTKWKCLELSAGERLCLKIVERDGQGVCSGCSGCLHRFWMRQRATRISRLKMQVAFVLPKLLMVIVICLKQLFPLYNVHILFAFKILHFAFCISHFAIAFHIQNVYIQGSSCWWLWLSLSAWLPRWAPPVEAWGRTGWCSGV